MKRKAYATWEKTTTMEKLELNGSATSGAVLRYDRKVLVVGRECFGYHAAIYEFAETPENTGLGDYECRLKLAATAEECFEDGGHAMAWCMARI